MRAIPLVSVVLMFLFPFAGSVASADGFAHVYPSTGDALLMTENAQLGIISYRDGTEMLAISVSVAERDLASGSTAAWMFPVPSLPEDVDIMLISHLQPFAGYAQHELADMAGRGLSTEQVFVMMSQVYTVPLSLVLLQRDFSPASLMVPDSRSAADGPEVEISETISSEGVVAELVSTDSGTALEDYLMSKGATLGDDELELVDEYVGEEYSFVVSWIEDTSSFMASAGSIETVDGDIFYSLGIGIEFPTERLYYPMKLTSAYGDTHVPMLVEAFGFCSPEDPGYDIDVEYLCYGTISLPAGTESYYFDQYDSDEFSYYEYTKIWIDVESSSLQEDLWMDPEPPTRVTALAYTVENPLVVAVLFSAVASLVASVLMAFVIFRPFRPRFERFALLSLLNFLSLIAIWLFVRSDKGRRFLVRPQNEPEPQVPRAMFSDFLVTYSVAYVVLVVMLPMVFVGLMAT